MKKLFSLLLVLTITVTGLCQTPEQIVSRMRKQIDTLSKSGVAMTVELKVPILGTQTTRCYLLDKKGCFEIKIKDAQVITWADSLDVWVYNSKENTVEISRHKESKSSKAGRDEMFPEFDKGYDMSIKAENNKNWQLECRKAKTNTDKDAPKTIDLIVAKGTYLPVIMRTKTSGITITMKDISYGVSEKKVTFDMNDYPGVKVVDKR